MISSIISQLVPNVLINTISSKIVANLLKEDAIMMIMEIANVNLHL